MSEQNKAMLSKSGLASEFIEKYLPLYDSILQVIIHHKKEDVDSAMLQTITRWADATPAHIVLATTGIKDENSMKDFIHSFSSKANTPWFRYFLQYDP